MALELIIFILSFLYSVGATFALIFLLSRFGFGSVIRNQGPEAHKAKSSTPALGGIGVIIGMGLCLIILFLMRGITSSSSAIFIAAIAFGLLGLTDDLLKRFLKSSEGLKARYRLPIQLIISIAFALWMMNNIDGHGIVVPGFENIWIPGKWLVAIDALLLAGFVNAFNFADGLDGLAGGLGVICIAVLGLIAWQSDLGTLPPVAVFIGLTGGFMVFNWHPARIFLGDGGAYALGGFIGAYAIITGLHIALIIGGFVIVSELLSVIIQVVSFRTTGKRVFAMTPIHHAFEEKGHAETSIVPAFLAAGLVCAAVCYTLFMFTGWGA